MKTVKRVPLYFLSLCAIQLHTSPISAKILNKRGSKPSMKTTHSKNTTKQKQKQRLAFPVYDEEDILDWDFTITPSLSRQSGTIKVRLIYKGRSKPMPVEDPWEE